MWSTSEKAVFVSLLRLNLTVQAKTAQSTARPTTNEVGILPILKHSTPRFTSPSDLTLATTRCGCRGRHRWRPVTLVRGLTGGTGRFPKLLAGFESTSGRVLNATAEFPSGPEKHIRPFKL